MSLTQFFYEEVSETVRYRCPQCEKVYEEDAPDFLSTLNYDCVFECVECHHEWKFGFVPLTRVVEHRDEAVGEGAEESPKTLRTEDVVVGDTCPRCRGAGHYVDYIGKRECSLCNGTGQVSPFSTR